MKLAGVGEEWSAWAAWNPNAPGTVKVVEAVSMASRFSKAILSGRTAWPVMSLGQREGIFHMRGKPRTKSVQVCHHNCWTNTAVRNKPNRFLVCENLRRLACQWFWIISSLHLCMACIDASRPQDVATTVCERTCSHGYACNVRRNAHDRGRDLRVHAFLEGVAGLFCGWFIVWISVGALHVVYFFVRGTVQLAGAQRASTNSHRQKGFHLVANHPKGHASCVW